MTEAPKVGFLCTGKTPLELAASIHCQSKMIPLLRSTGFVIGGSYTEMLECDTPEKIKRAGKTLEYLCHANDLVFTLGCDGFAPGDAIPDITEIVCTGTIPYFTNILCGSQPVCISQKTQDTRPPKAPEKGSHSRIERIYPDNATSKPFCPRSGLLQKHPMLADKQTRHSLCVQLNRAFVGVQALFSVPTEKDLSSQSNSRMTPQAVSRVFSTPHTSTASFSARSHSHSPSQELFYAPPSRAQAGLLERALLLNFPGNAFTALPLLENLLGQISFSVCHISGKSAASHAAFEKSLKSNAEFESSCHFKHVVNK